MQEVSSYNTYYVIERRMLMSFSVVLCYVIDFNL